MSHYTSPGQIAVEAIVLHDALRKRVPGYVERYHGADVPDAIRYVRTILDAELQAFIARSDVHAAAMALLLHKHSRRLAYVETENEGSEA